MKGIWRSTLWMVVWFVIFSGIQGGSPIHSANIRVVYFLSPGCTICQFYTLRMRELYGEYDDKGVSFQGVFSAASCNEKVIADFTSKYQVPFEIVCDTTLHETLNATVTPEVFVLNAENVILYSGRIDDSYAAIGKRRPRAKHHELTDALDAVLRGDSVEVKHTQPVGCIIQK